MNRSQTRFASIAFLESILRRCRRESRERSHIDLLRFRLRFPAPAVLLSHPHDFSYAVDGMERPPLVKSGEEIGISETCWCILNPTAHDVKAFTSVHDGVVIDAAKGRKPFGMDWKNVGSWPFFGESLRRNVPNHLLPIDHGILWVFVEHAGEDGEAP